MFQFIDPLCGIQASRYMGFSNNRSPKRDPVYYDPDYKDYQKRPLIFENPHIYSGFELRAFRILRGLNGPAKRSSAGHNAKLAALTTHEGKDPVFWFQGPKTTGISENMVCRILMFLYHILFYHIPYIIYHKVYTILGSILMFLWSFWAP